MVPCLVLERVIEDYRDPGLEGEDAVCDAQFCALGARQREVDAKLLVGRPMVGEDVGARALAILIKWHLVQHEVENIPVAGVMGQGARAIGGGDFLLGGPGRDLEGLEP
eukprot:scaffold140335_cov30-Tisochrysis_lutea.AAC.2